MAGKVKMHAVENLVGPSSPNKGHGISTSRSSKNNNKVNATIADMNRAYDLMNGHGNNMKISAKSLDKKAQQLKKRFQMQQKPRLHTQSCSGAYETYEDAEEMLQIKSTSNKAKKLHWGKPGDELTLDGRPALDENDPNYDSEMEESTWYTRTAKASPASTETAQPAITKTKPLMPTTQRDFEGRVHAWLMEYFDHGDAQEVCNLLRELQPTRSELTSFPTLAIGLAVEKKPHQRELVSRLLSIACDAQQKGLMNHALMEEAFHSLLVHHLRDMTVDAPDAPEIVGCFIARAIADDVIPPSFVANHKGRVRDLEAIRALRKADNLLHIPHAFQHLDVVWVGPAGLRRSADLPPPTKDLQRAFGLLLKEYMDARDKREVDRTLRELHAPHFLHELVFQAVLVMIERSTEDACATLVDLLQYIYTTGRCSGEMMAKGLRRVYQQLPDISLDVPAAYLILDRFLKQAQASGFVSAALVKEMPLKKRPRFISENVGRFTAKSP